MLILGELRLDGGVARLEHMLDDDDPDVRLVTCAGLPLAEHPDAVNALVRALSHRRLAPERVIERLGQPWAVGALLDSLHELDAEGERRSAPRIGIARALGAAGDPRAEPALVDLLRSGNLEERISAARALGNIGGAPRAPSSSGAAGPRVAAARAGRQGAGQGRPRASVTALEAVLDDPAWWVRANAAGAPAQPRRARPRGARARARPPDRYARDRAREALAMDRLSLPVA